MSRDKFCVNRDETLAVLGGMRLRFSPDPDNNAYADCEGCDLTDGGCAPARAGVYPQLCGSSRRDSRSGYWKKDRA